MTDLAAGSYCVDFDEGAMNTHNCGHKIICNNIENDSPDDAGFTCTCAPGFADEETPCPAGASLSTNVMTKPTHVLQIQTVEILKIHFQQVFHLATHVTVMMVMKHSPVVSHQQ